MNRALSILAFLTLLAAGPASSQVEGHQKVSDTEGGFTGVLDNADEFGTAVARLGDLDGDGNADLAVGAPFDDDGCPVTDLDCDKGAVWVLFLNADGTVGSHQKVSDTEGGFNGVLDAVDWFGTSVAAPGDLDDDGVPDLVVGAPLDDDGGLGFGAVWVLFLNADGTVSGHQKISQTAGGFTGDLDQFDEFGIAVAGLGDLNGDGVGDLAVGSPFDDDGGGNQGAVWVLLLDADGTVASHQKLFIVSSPPSDFEEFGHAVAGLGDLDGDGVGDLAVGAPLDDDEGFDQGTVWVYRLNPDGTAAGAPQKIGEGDGGFTGDLEGSDFFGRALAHAGDIDGDAVPDLVVGAPGDDDGGLFGSDVGAVWVLLMNADGTVRSQEKVSATAGGFTGDLDEGDNFGASVAGLGDLDGDGDLDLAVGAPKDDDGGIDRGAVWALFLTGTRPAVTVTASPVSPPVFIPAGGGSFQFTVTLTNLTAQPQTFQAWSSVTGPVDREPVIGPQTVTLPAGATITRTLTQQVPGAAPAGLYTYLVRVGIFPGTVLASDGFTVTKLAAQEGAGITVGTADSWAVSGWEPVTASSATGPVGFVVSEVYPNPLRAQANLTLEVAEAQHVTVEVYDGLGRRVATLHEGVLDAGAHVFGFDGSSLPAGVYFIRLTADSVVQTQRVTLVR